MNTTVCIKFRFNEFYTVLTTDKKGVREVRGQIFTIILNYFVFFYVFTCVIHICYLYL